MAEPVVMENEVPAVEPALNGDVSEAELAELAAIDPEIQAELIYAKEHGLDTAALKLKILKKHGRLGVGEAHRQVNGVVHVARSLKNQRKPRNGKGRGMPKKDGAGGKWTWGAANRVYEEPEFIDSDDPNYDSDAQANVTYESINPELSEADFTKYVEPVIREYLANGDVKEILETLDEMALPRDLRPRVVRFAVTLSLDGKPSQRELVSQLLAEGVAQRTLTTLDAERGFRQLVFTDLADLSVDYPTAAEMVGNFAARAVADEALSGDFVSADGRENADSPQATEALERAEALLKQKHRLDQVWGVGGGQRPVRYLTNKIRLLLDEYLSSGDAAEAGRCLRDLEVPHFHHEVVYQAGVTVIEAMHERTSRLLAELVAELWRNGTLSVDAVRTGFQRLYAAMPDLCLDVPPAYTLLERWVAACRQQGFLPEDVIKKMPQKGRKRFVSEGDGGRLKVIDVPHPLI